MKTFLRDLLLFAVPMIALGIVYVATDVFKVIWHHEPFHDDTHPVAINRAHESTMVYLQQNPRHHYDSFIFGNSRSLFYEADTWKQHLPAGSSPFHFDASRGSVGMVHDAVAFIDRQGGRLSNVIIVFDHEILSTMEQTTGYLFVTPPPLKQNRNLASFHMQHFMAFLNPKFLTALADFRLTGTFRPYMENLIAAQHSTYLPVANEYQEPQLEAAIARGTYYDATHISAFEGVQTPGTWSQKSLGKEETESLKDIRRIFDRHHTNYKIVISPLYDQVRLNPAALQTLQHIFGKAHVYDFSGPNKWNSDYHNYYEASHYRPHVAAEIMKTIYADDPSR